MIRKSVSGALTPLSEKRQVRAVFSSATLDRMGDVVVQAGIGLDAYRKNPIILWSHDPTQPIGRCVSVAVVDGALRGLVQFPVAGVSKTADEVYGLIVAGIVNATSIGFAPTEAEPFDKAKPWAGGTRFLRSALLEISFVAVPANAEALVTERAAARARVSVTVDSPAAARARKLREREVEVLRLSAPPLTPAEIRQREYEVFVLAGQVS